MKTLPDAVTKNIGRHLIGTLIAALSLLVGSLPGAVPRSAADGPVLEEQVTAAA